MLAGGWLPDFVRLGELERHLGEGVIKSLAAAAAAEGRMPVPQRKRIMSFPLTIRLAVAMTLMVRHEALVRREALGIEGGARPPRQAVAAVWRELSAVRSGRRR